MDGISESTFRGAADASEDGDSIAKLGSDPFPVVFVDAKQAPYIQKRISQHNRQVILDFIQAAVTT